MSGVRSGSGSRAIGAMFFSIFGGAWLVLWCVRAFGAQPVVLTLVALATVAVFMVSLREYRRSRPEQGPEEDSPEKRKADRLFYIANAGQWIGILVVGNVLANLRLAQWIIPAAIFIVGLHFFPLARAFNNPSHYVTGGALTLIALVYPLVAPSGAASSVGCLAAGIILWASALHAVT